MKNTIVIYDRGSCSGSINGKPTDQKTTLKAINKNLKIGKASLKLDTNTTLIYHITQ